VRQDERQIKENQRHLIGEIMHAVHDEAQTVGLKSGDRFNDENRSVKRGGYGERLAIMLMIGATREMLHDIVSAQGQARPQRPTAWLGVQDSNSETSQKISFCPAWSASIIPCPNAVELSNNIIQKGLAFGHDWSGTVVNLERLRAPRSCPAGSMAEVGLWWCGATPSSTETEDLDVKICEEAVTLASTHGTDCRKAIAAGNGQSRAAA
jgi:hypothetical protein